MFLKFKVDKKICLPRIMYTKKKIMCRKYDVIPNTYNNNIYT